VDRQKCTLEAKTSNDNRPITSHKCLSKTQLPKHVNDSLHRRLISDSNRRLYKTIQLTQTLTPVHSALLATMCFICSMLYHHHIFIQNQLRNYTEKTLLKPLQHLDHIQKPLSYWTKSLKSDVEKSKQFNLISGLQKQFHMGKMFDA